MSTNDLRWGAIWLRMTTLYLQTETKEKRLFNLTVAPDTYQG